MRGFHIHDRAVPELSSSTHADEGRPRHGGGEEAALTASLSMWKYRYEQGVRGTEELRRIVVLLLASPHLANERLYGQSASDSLIKASHLGNHGQLVQLHSGCVAGLREGRSALRESGISCRKQRSGHLT
jgi:hypothetical protein